MSKVLVAGIETAVGGNLAACLARTQSVTGVCLSEPASISGLDIDTQVVSSSDDLNGIIERVGPQRVIFCGAGSRTAWESSSPPTERDVAIATDWIQAARQAQTHLTLISSGAVFTGPWMFHAETSHSFCDSAPAQCLRAIEAKAEEVCPDSLIIRTHAIGWQPGGKPGWIEGLLDQLEANQANGLDCFRHASPLLASDLADIICRSWSAGLSGIYHVAGAERSNPVQFARRMSHHFQLPIVEPNVTESLVDRPTGFGCGETSLQTRKIRRALHIAMPMLEETVLRLFQQHADGYRTRVSGHSVVPGSRVA